MKIIQYTDHSLLSFTSERITDYSGIANYLNKIGQQININRQQFIWANQTHSSNIKVVSEIPSTPVKNTDGFITNKKNICLCVFTADCTPVIYYDATKQTIGIAHAGWRGTAQNITGKMIRLFKTKFHSNPADISAIIGPCITQPVYQVGKNVFDEFCQLPYDIDSAFKPDTNGKYLLDLKLANKIILINEGLKEENITISPYCTVKNNNRFYSARKEGIETGRIMSGVMMK